MIRVNAVDLSEFQDPKKIDYQAMKNAGIETLIIRASVDLRLDHHAAEHIANAKKYGFNWHLYHYFYNDTNEAQFAVNAAKSLGLGSDQILFLDMEDKSLPKNWNEQFTDFRKTVDSNFKVGLYCSDSPYQAKFSDSQLTSMNVVRWIASYSYEPKHYDVWQKSGSGSGGFGTYTEDIDRDVDPNNILAISSSKPYVPTSEDKMVRQIILQAGYDTETGIYGLGCSFDNGATFKVYWTIYGQKFYQEDANRLWPFLIDKVKAVMSGSLNVDWSDIQNKPDLSQYVTKDELPAQPDLSGYAKTSDIPNSMDWNQITDKPSLALTSDIPSLDGYAKLTDIPSVTGLVKEAELDDYAKKTDLPVIPDLTPYAKLTDLNKYALATQIPTTMAWDSITNKPTLALKSDIPSLTGYAKLTDIPSVSGLVKETELADYAKKSVLANYYTKAETDTKLSSKANLKAQTVTSGTLASLGPGVYDVGFIASDAPESNWGMLQVDAGSNYVKQIYTARAGMSLHVYVRIKNGVSQYYDPWNQITVDTSVFATKAGLSDYYTKIETDTKLSSKADKSDLPDLSKYAKKSDIPASADLSGYATISSLIDYVKKTDLPDFTLFAKKSDIPVEQDLSNYAKKDDLNKYVTNETYSQNKTSLENTIQNLRTSLSNQNQVQTITSGTLADLASAQGSYHYEIDFVPSDGPTSDWGLLDVIVGEHYAKQVFTVTGATGDDQGNVYVRVRDYSGQWHEWREITAWN